MEQTRSRFPILEERSHAEVVRSCGSDGWIPLPQKSQTLIVLLYILQKLEPGRKRTSHRNSFLALIRQLSPKPQSQSLFAIEKAIRRPKGTGMSGGLPGSVAKLQGWEHLPTACSGTLCPCPNLLQ